MAFHHIHAKATYERLGLCKENRTFEQTITFFRHHDFSYYIHINSNYTKLKNALYYSDDLSSLDDSHSLENLENVKLYSTTGDLFRDYLRNNRIDEVNSANLKKELYLIDLINGWDKELDQIINHYFYKLF